MCPVAEALYEQILSLPMHAGMTDEDVKTVCATLQNVLEP
jgi:dTDP-4-amino-4,6-dideoxygalactose transaminase